MEIRVSNRLIRAPELDTSSTPAGVFPSYMAPSNGFSRGSAVPPAIQSQNSSTINGVIIGLVSSFGSAILIALIFFVVYFFKYTAGGRILLDRIGRPGEYDDEQAFLREEAEALEEMDDLQRTEYLRAKGRPR
jgi:hypothetical protein